MFKFKALGVLPALKTENLDSPPTSIPTDPETRVKISNSTVEYINMVLGGDDDLTLQESYRICKGKSRIHYIRTNISNRK